MKKIWLLLIIGLLLSACASSQTEAPPTQTPLPPSNTHTPIPPTDTPEPFTPTPNPHAERLLFDFADSINEAEIDRALTLFSEDSQIITGDPYKFEGLEGVERFVIVASSATDIFIEISNLKIQGDTVEFFWFYSYTYISPPLPTGTDEISCNASATIIEDKILELIIPCVTT